MLRSTHLTKPTVLSVKQALFSQMAKYPQPLLKTFIPEELSSPFELLMPVYFE